MGLQARISQLRRPWWRAASTFRRWIFAKPSRYAVSGAICAILNNIILIGGDRLGMDYLPLVLLSWLIGGSTGFALHAKVSFRTKVRWRGYVQFMAGIALAIPVALAVIVLLTRVFGFPMAMAAPTATVAMIAYNYLNARLAILRSLPFCRHRISSRGAR